MLNHVLPEFPEVNVPVDLLMVYVGVCACAIIVTAIRHRIVKIFFIMFKY